MTDKRERRLDALTDALDENTKSKAIDRAIGFTLQMRGNSVAYPTGKFEELIKTAEERGNLTAAEIAEILDTQEIPVEYESQWFVGDTGRQNLRWVDKISIIAQ